MNKVVKSTVCSYELVVSLWIKNRTKRWCYIFDRKREKILEFAQWRTFFIANAISGGEKIDARNSKRGLSLDSRFRRKDKHILRVCFLGNIYIYRVKILDNKLVGYITTVSEHYKKNVSWRELKERVTCICLFRSGHWS